MRLGGGDALRVSNGMNYVLMDRLFPKDGVVSHLESFFTT